LFPINWPEPFGMVMAEAMACGTPVIAYRGGSVPEVIDDGVTGLVCDDIEQATAAVGRVHELSRAGCRRAFEQRFTAARMSNDYTAIYHRLVEARGAREPRDFRDSRRGAEEHGEPDDHGHDGRQHGDSRGLLHPRNQLASG
jgi:hypothetical protein